MRRLFILVLFLIILLPAVFADYRGVVIGQSNQTTIVINGSTTGGGGFAAVQGPYLYNTTTLFFNDTLLNITILNLTTSTGGGGGNMSYTNLFLLNQSNTAQGLTTFNENVTLAQNKTLQLNTAADRASQGQPLEIWATTQQAKAYIGFYSYDAASNQIRQTGWMGTHYNTSANPDPHQHFAIEVLENTTGTPDLNSHFEISYGSNVTTPIVQFPDSWVRMKDNQRFQFGDTGMFNITYTSANGKLAITGPGTDLQTPTIDLQGADIWRVDDIIGNTGGVPLDLKANTAIRLFPANQTTFAFQLTNNSAGDLVINAVGTTNLRFEGDNVSITQLATTAALTNFSGLALYTNAAATEYYLTPSSGHNLKVNGTGTLNLAMVGGVQYNYLQNKAFVLENLTPVLGCNSTNYGQIIYPQDLGKAMYCSGNGWRNITDSTNRDLPSLSPSYLLASTAGYDIFFNSTLLNQTITSLNTGGSGMDYTNLALINITNDFAHPQNIRFTAPSIFESGQAGLVIQNLNTSSESIVMISSANNATVNLIATSIAQDGLLSLGLPRDSSAVVLDGKNAAVITNSIGDNLSIRIGDGTGGFATPDQILVNRTAVNIDVPITQQGQTLCLSNGTGCAASGSFTPTNVAFLNNTQTFIGANTFNDTVRGTSNTLTGSTPGAAHTAWAFITNQNGSKGALYQQVIMTGDGQTAYGNYFLTHDGGGNVLTNRSIYSTQNEMYVGANGNSSNSADAYGVFNYVGQTGLYSRVFGTTSIILNTANNSQSFGTYNLITCGSFGSQCISQADLAYSYNSLVNKTLQGIATDVRPSNPGDSALGVNVQTNSTPLANPTGDMIGLLVNWSIPGGDANNKKYGVYVAHTSSSSAKSYFGDPVYFNGTGPGAIFNTQANFNDIAVFNNLVGIYNTMYLFGSIQAIAGSSITMNDAAFNMVNSASTVPLLTAINTNSSSLGRLSFTSTGFPGGGQLNLYTGGSNAVGDNAQFNNRSVIQGNNLLDIGIENVGGHVTLRASAATQQAQVNVTSTDVWLRANVQVSADKLLRLAPNTTSMTCNSSNIGSFIFSNSTASPKHYGCDGVNWNALY